jgi:hypothetical protein
MWRLVESLLAKPKDSDIATAASLLFPLAGGLIAILAAAPEIRAWMYASFESPHLTFLRLILPLPAAALAGAVPGAIIGALVDRRASARARFAIVRCRQIVVLLLSVALVVWCAQRLLVYADLYTFLVFVPILSIIGLSQTRWRLRLRHS